MKTLGIQKNLIRYLSLTLNKSIQNESEPQTQYKASNSETARVICKENTSRFTDRQELSGNAPIAEKITPRIDQ